MSTSIETQSTKFWQAVNSAIIEEMERDERVVVAGEDIALAGGPYGVTRGLLDRFGADRVRDTPISESVIVGLGVGAAAVGLRPIVEIMFFDFTMLAMDQIVNQAAKFRYFTAGTPLPLVIRTMCGAGGPNGAQHSQNIEDWFCQVPGLKVVMPSGASDCKGLLKSAIRDDDPVLFIETLGLLTTREEVPVGNDHLVPLGVADVKRPGRDLTIVTWSREVLFALEAASRLADEGVEAEVVDVRTLVPLDKDRILSSVRKTHRVLVVHEAIKRGGYGAEIASLIAEEAFDDLDAPPKRLAGIETPIPYAQHLEKSVVPQVEDIVRVAKELVA